MTEQAYEYVFLTLLGAMLVFVACIPVWQILHFILCPRYDKHLFKQPYFRPMEIAVLSSWPLSLFRSLAYILFVAAPSVAKWRRFVGAEPDVKNGLWLVLLCRLFLFSLIATAAIFFPICIWGYFFVEPT